MSSPTPWLCCEVSMPKRLVAPGAAPPAHGSAVLPHPRPARWRSRGRRRWPIDTRLLMHGRKRLTVLAALAVLALVAGGCSSGPRDGGGITIGAIYPTSGSQGPGGGQEANGARLAVEL